MRKVKTVQTNYITAENKGENYNVISILFNTTLFIIIAFCFRCTYKREQNLRGFDLIPLYIFEGIRCRHVGSQSGLIAYRRIV